MHGLSVVKYSKQAQCDLCKGYTLQCGVDVLSTQRLLNPYCASITVVPQVKPPFMRTVPVARQQVAITDGRMQEQVM